MADIGNFQAVDNLLFQVLQFSWITAENSLQTKGLVNILIVKAGQVKFKRFGFLDIQNKLLQREEEGYCR